MQIHENRDKCVTHSECGPYTRSITRRDADNSFCFPSYQRDGADLPAEDSGVFLCNNMCYKKLASLVIYKMALEKNEVDLFRLAYLDNACTKKTSSTLCADAMVGCVCVYVCIYV